MGKPYENDMHRLKKMQRDNPGVLTRTNTVTGTLKGYDQLMNLVLDDVKEITRGKLLPPPSCPSLLPLFLHIIPVPARDKANIHEKDDEGQHLIKTPRFLVAHGTLLIPTLST